MSVKLVKRRHFQALWFFCSVCYMVFLYFFESILAHAAGSLFFMAFLVPAAIVLILFNYLYVCIFFYQEAVDYFFRNLLFAIPFFLFGVFLLPGFYEGGQRPPVEAIIDAVKYLFAMPLALIFIQLFFIRTYALNLDLRGRILTCVKAYIYIVIIEMVINVILWLVFGAEYLEFL